MMPSGRDKICGREMGDKSKRASTMRSATSRRARVSVSAGLRSLECRSISMGGRQARRQKLDLRLQVEARRRDVAR
jgi:hypothetical protein